VRLERVEVRDAGRERDAARHSVEEVQVIVGADQLEELEHRRDHLRLDDKRRTLVRADIHGRALLDDALFDDATGLNEANAKDLRSCLNRHRAHDRGHLTGPRGSSGRRPCLRLSRSHHGVDSSS